MTNENLQLCNILGEDIIKPDQTGTMYVVLEKNPETKIVSCTVESLLKFRAQLIDDEGNVENEYEDDYTFEEVYSFPKPSSLSK